MKHNTSSISTGGALVALSALGFATNPILGKFSYQAGANAVTLGSIRFTTAAILLWVMLLATRKAGGLTVGMRVRLLAMGALGFAMVALLYFTALEHIGASLATGIFYTHPAMVAVAGTLRGQHMSRWAWGGLLLTAAGTWLMLGADLGGFTWGGALMILAAAGLYTAYMIVGELWGRDVAPTVVSAHVTAGASAVYLAIAVATGQTWPTAAQAYLSAVGLALCSTILALITFFAGLPKVGPSRAAIISMLEPVFTTLLAVLLLSERLGGLQTLGIGLVVAGAVAAQLKDRASVLAQETRA